MALRGQQDNPLIYHIEHHRIREETRRWPDTTRHDCQSPADLPAPSPAPGLSRDMTPCACIKTGHRIPATLKPDFISLLDIGPMVWHGYVPR